MSLNQQLFSYKWNKFGPYSEELKYMLDDAVLEDLISIKPRDLQIKGALQFNMKLSDYGKRIAKDVRIDNEITQSVEFVYKFLSSELPREMELLASVHYIISKLNDGDEEVIHKILTRLKSEAGFNLSDVQRAKNKLLENKIITN